MDYEESPCQGLCEIDKDGQCRGCGRYRVEIAHWRGFDADEKKQVWERLKKTKGLEPRGEDD